MQQDVERIKNKNKCNKTLHCTSYTAGADYADTNNNLDLNKDESDKEEEFYLINSNKT